MRIPPVSRRKFIATGSALLASTNVPDRAEAFHSSQAHDAARAEAADAALARAPPLMVPALKLSAFTFTSVSDAI